MKVEILYKVTKRATSSNGGSERSKTFETVDEAQNEFDNIIAPLCKRANKERENGKSSFCNSMRIGEGFIRNIHATIAIDGAYITLKLETIVNQL